MNHQNQEKVAISAEEFQKRVEIEFCYIVRHEYMEHVPKEVNMREARERISRQYQAFN